MEEKKDSFVFYRSFYEAIKNLDSKDRLKIYDAICELALNNNEPKNDVKNDVKNDNEPKNDAKNDVIFDTIFALIKPQILANYKKYENGRKRW